MNECDMRLEVSRADRVYRPGETIRGTLTLKVREDCHCKDLLITLRWRTRGKGNKAEGDPVKVSLGSHDWQTGQEHKIPFEIEAPAGPLSYDGTLLRVLWELRAEADTSVWADPKTDPLVVRLERWTAETLTQEGGSYRAPPKHWAGEYGLGPTARQSVPGAPPSTLMGCGAVAALGGVLLLAAPWGSNAVGGGIVMAVVGAVLFLFALPKYLAQRRIGTPIFRCEPSEVCVGGDLCVTLTLRPKAEARVNGVSVRLLGREKVTKGSGKKATTYRQDLHEQRGELSLGAKRLKAGKTYCGELKLKIPEDAAPSFGAMYNEVFWEIDVRIDIAGWPDWKDGQRIVVVPAPPDAAQGSISG